MNRTMITATNTLGQLQKQMDVISNNISNVETTGFKRREATFTDLLVQQFNNASEDTEAARLTPDGIRQGSGARLGQIQMIMAQGAIKATDRPLDTAFTKEGLYYRIQVQTADGYETQYTRDGAFYLSPLSDSETMLVTTSGHPVLDEDNNPVIIAGKAEEYTINETGTLTVSLADGSEQSINLGVSLVNQPQFLEKKGSNLLGLPAGAEAEGIFTDLDGNLRGQIAIRSGALELSNVDLSKEMTDLMTAQRSYQFQARSINMADQMMGLINGIR
ncbi:flagellar hook-basal body protein [Bacillus tuaregi]|uniref:flagellar hook-basal body protein n=1 Tax=Bacillus tuaregi TaxID=1816695 RepID=UPI0008F960FB|nr:flagellar hook-basal body protein [Bacillus tuaregi]